MKKRLDLVVMEKGLAKSRQRARALIMAGKVFINGKLADKPGTLVDSNLAKDTISVKADIPYVSRGGLKLEEALKTFALDVNNFLCLDVGASTGGFTDCLLQNGAKSIFAVDVGYGQLDWKLRQDPRVTVIERTNIRYISKSALPCLIDLVTIDVSFISLKIVIPAIVKFMKQTAMIIALIKPQFEVGKGKVGKGGVVRDGALHLEVIEDLSDFFVENGFIPSPAISSPILGPKGNKEFFVLLKLAK